jgi:mannose-1-phosphate guanylyltransferase
MPLRKWQSHRWAVILAGGDGTRLLSLTRRLTGDDRPKQFCALTGGDTLLHQTRRRAARLVAEQRTLLMLTQTHERFYASQVADVAPARLLIQPFNHGTAPAIAYSALRLQRMDANAVLAFFPSDHHFSDDEAFVAQVGTAFEQAEALGSRVILLGIAPEAPEESYAWIEPGTARMGACYEVRRFWEKPHRSIASQLFRRGCLWNTFVMIGRASAFAGLIRNALPSLVESLESMLAVTAPGRENDALRDLYLSIPAANFSDQVLSANPAALAVLRADGLGWSDLGEPQRVFSVMQSAGQFEWLRTGREVPA